MGKVDGGKAIVSGSVASRRPVVSNQRLQNKIIEPHFFNATDLGLQVLLEKFLHGFIKFKSVLFIVKPMTLILFD